MEKLLNMKISLGKTLDGENDVSLDLSKDNIHTIVFSGSTGSGKSTFHHSITKQLMTNNSLNEVGFIFMDFKRVEFGEYKNSDYLLRPIIYDPKEAVTVLKDLIYESEQRYTGIKNSKKAIIVHIEECDIVLFAPGLLDEVWKTIDEQSDKNNIYILFSASRPSDDVFTKKILDHSNLKGVFVPGDLSLFNSLEQYTSRLLGHSLETLPKPWTKIFQLKAGKEIVCKA